MSGPLRPSDSLGVFRVLQTRARLQVGIRSVAVNAMQKHLFTASVLVQLVAHRLRRRHKAVPEGKGLLHFPVCQCFFALN